jgi:cellobiose dehydrogenase (acceptor)
MDGQRYDQELYGVMSKWLSGNGFTQTDTFKNPNDKHAVFGYPPSIVCTLFHRPRNDKH